MSDYDWLLWHCQADWGKKMESENRFLFFNWQNLIFDLIKCCHFGITFSDWIGNVLILEMCCNEIFKWKLTCWFLKLICWYTTFIWLRNFVFCVTEINFVTVVCHIHRMTDHLVITLWIICYIDSYIVCCLYQMWYAREHILLSPPS